MAGNKRNLRCWAPTCYKSLTGGPRLLSGSCGSPALTGISCHYLRAFIPSNKKIYTIHFNHLIRYYPYFFKFTSNVPLNLFP
jgi:hypothetical protein